MARTNSLPTTTHPAGQPCPLPTTRRPRHGRLGLRVAGSPALPNVARRCSVGDAGRRPCADQAGSSGAFPHAVAGRPCSMTNGPRAETLRANADQQVRTRSASDRQRLRWQHQRERHRNGAAPATELDTVLSSTVRGQNLERDSDVAAGVGCHGAQRTGRREQRHGDLLTGSEAPKHRTSPNRGQPPNRERRSRRPRWG
jgi:hypothetical protein